MEIERKFLLDCLPINIEKFKKKELSQTYISFMPELRARKEDNKYILTKKIGAGMVRDESNKEVDRDLYDFLIKGFGQIINKTRYEIPLSSKTTAEIDVYHDKLDGLKVVEVEFGTVEEANNFEVPNWFGTEVTDDPYYKNANLSTLEKLDSITKKKN